MKSAYAYTSVNGRNGRLRSPRPVMLSGLGSSMLEWLGKSVWGAEFDDAVITVHHRCVAKYQDWWCRNLTLEGCLPYDVVDTILKCYTNLAAAGTIPEYVPNTTVEFRAKIIQPIMQCSGSTWQIIHQCLYELYHATKEGEVENSAIIAPATAFKYAQQRSAPAHVNSAEKDADNSLDFLDELLTWLKWIAIIGGIGVAGYFIWNAVALVDKVTPDAE